MTGRRHYQSQGFTLIELLVVMVIIGLLLSIAVPRYFRTLQHAKETVLRQDLTIMREAIDKHYADLEQYPATLSELVDRHYIRALPPDPFTRLTDSWVVVASDDPDHAGVRDVHSGSSEAASDGTLVAQW